MTDDMTRLAAELITEFSHNYSQGRVTLAVDALPGDGTGPLVQALAAELASRDITVSRIAIPDAGSADAFRALILPAFRTDTDLPSHAVLLAEGTGLHAPGIVDVWSMSVWASAQQEPDPADADLRRYLTEVDPPRRADVIVDIADPAHPVRRFSDWCAVPRRRG